MTTKSIEINRAGIKEIQISLMQKAATGGQIARIKKVYLEYTGLDDTKWLELKRSSVESGRLTGDAKDWGLTQNEKQTLIGTIDRMFKDNDKQGVTLPLEGVKCGSQSMLRDLWDVLMEMLPEATAGQMKVKDRKLWIRTTYFNNIAERMVKLTGYSRNEILSELKTSECLMTASNRPYDYQISDTKAEEKCDRHPRYIVIKMDVFKKKSGKEKPEKKVVAEPVTESVTEQETEITIPYNVLNIRKDDDVYMSVIRFFQRWGSKKGMVSDIRPLIPEHDTYVETHGGSAAVLLNHPKSKREILNDKDPDIYLLYKIMKDPDATDDFLEEIKNLKYDEGRFNKALDAKKDNYMGMREIIKAVHIFVLLTQSYDACMKRFSKKTVADYQVRNYFNLREVAKRLKDVEIYNVDALEIIEPLKDDENVFMLLDPPYWQKLRAAKNAYEIEMNEEEQRKLLEAIKDSKCKIMLCGYRAQDGNNLYDEVLRTSTEGNWHCYLLKDVPKPGIKDSRAEEYIWVNYELPDGWEYVINTKDYMAA